MISLIETGVAVEFAYTFDIPKSEVEALAGEGVIHSVGFHVRQPPPDSGGSGTICARIDCDVRALPIEGEQSSCMTRAQA